MKVENRSQLYYGKYRYRATLYLRGLNRTYRATTFLDFLKRLEQQLSEVDNSGWAWTATRKEEIKLLDLDALERFIIWRNHNFNKNRKPQNLLIRIESFTAGVFSNDIALLKTLATIDPGNPLSVTFSEVDPCVPQGTMYFAKEPKHKFRVYLKGVLVPAGFRDSVKEVVARYKSTTSELFPCGALYRWMNSTQPRWPARYCSAGFYLEYDQDSTYTLLSLMFDQMIAKRFVLEKRPV